MAVDKFIIAFDVDGTVVIGNESVDHELIELIQIVKNMGHIVTLITGRLPSGMVLQAEEMDISKNVLCAGGDGGSLYRWMGNEFIKQNVKTMGCDKLSEIMMEFEPPGIVLKSDSLETVGRGPALLTHLARITSPNISDLLSWREVDFTQDITGLRFLLPPGKHGDFIKTLENYTENQVEFYRGEDFDNSLTGISIKKHGTSKGTAMMEIASDLAIDPEKTFAAGDWVNDIPMLKVAKYSYCPSDSSQRVKDSAKTVVKMTSKQNWACEALRHFCRENLGIE